MKFRMRLDSLHVDSNNVEVTPFLAPMKEFVPGPMAIRIGLLSDGDQTTNAFEVAQWIMGYFRDAPDRALPLLDVWIEPVLSEVPK